MMNIAKFLKGTITIPQLENVSNRSLQIYYREYYKMVTDPKLTEQFAKEQAGEQLIEAMGG